MYRTERYNESDKMCDLVGDNYRVLLIMSRYNISLGFGDKSIDQVCRENNVDTATFLAIVNLLLYGNEKNDVIDHISAESIIFYLQHSHDYFLDFRLPAIRQDLVEVLGKPDNDLSKAIIRYFDEYVAEVHKHMTYEEKTVFPYVKALIKGEKLKNYSINTFRTQHDQIEARLSEFKTILIKYYTTASTNEINKVLFEIFNCEEDLASHNEIENNLFIPLVVKLEEETEQKAAGQEHETMASKQLELLSVREKEIIALVVKGLTSKQIADKLYLSTHTVATHRRNISSKLQIRSTAGLTIYAIVNKLVELEDVKNMSLK